MLSSEQNELVTRTNSGTGCGELMRRYWQPAALVEELEGARPLKQARLFGEDLIVFRGEDGQIGLVGNKCPHRGAELCYGRLEDGGLRCPFHGWLFGPDGVCREQPAEPAGSNFHTKVQLKSYPCREINGIIFAYMGDGDAPELPEFDCFVAPNSHSFAFKGFVDCNWLQLLEVGIDPSHASFLHRFFEDGETEQDYGRQFRFRTEDDGIPVTKVLREFDCPEIEFEETEYGLRIFALRRLDEAQMHVRVTNMIFPNVAVIPMSNDMMLTQWHVPIDDEHSFWYAIFTSFNDQVDKDAMREDRLKLYTLPDYKPRRNKANDYGYDAREQKSKTYTGLGEDINVHDQWAVESLGQIQDRSQEHLGTSDKAIIANRRILMKAIEDVRGGAKPPGWVVEGDEHLFRGPISIDTVAPANEWRRSWMERAQSRRAKSEWAAEP
ncbi:MAG: aromatic ring-hydroxylating dioxygenase subunit alpha [Rhodospirillales bacterium]|nr:aromatic ring-hydroxylating dioxygenase subunit alpha [Rhodospirillales bacterium]